MGTARKNNNDKFKLEEGNQEGREASVIYPILMEDEDNDGDGDRRRAAAAASGTKCALTSLVSATAHGAAMA